MTDLLQVGAIGSAGVQGGQVRGHGRAVQARTAGYLLMAGAMLAPLTAYVPPVPDSGPGPILALGVIAAAVGALLLAFPGRAPSWSLAPLVALGTVLITASMKLAGLHAHGADSAMLYVLVVLYAFYFMPVVAAVMELALVGAAYGWLLLGALPPDAVLARWLTTMAVLVAAGLLVSRLNARLDGLIEALRASARQDPLTGVLNRRGFDERFALELARSRRTREPLSLLMVDLDHFKRLNDTRGHEAGDQALRRVAMLLSKAARDVDAVGRIGGEEFGVLVPGSSGPMAWRVAERLREQLARESWGWSTPVTLSIGVASCPPLETDQRELMRAADAALYRAKDLGRDRTVEAAGPEMVEELASA
jgi:diguanylate cyclase (GGDEF)-like protein